MKEYIALDVETSGLDPLTDRIVEIACVRFNSQGDILGQFQSLINPCTTLSYEVIQVHGITNEMVVDQPTFLEVWVKCFEFLGTACDPALLAHNSKFDAGFLSEEIKRLGITLMGIPVTFEHDLICTMAFARSRDCFLRRYNLPSLVSRFQLPAVDGFHRALADCYHVMNLWLKLNGPAYDPQKLVKHKVKNT
jgi:DNA polymerase III epsilon subunit family exonuclease